MTTATATALNPIAKSALLSVLRDPDVVQIREWLHNGANGFCLAGALAEAYRRTTKDGKWVYGMYRDFSKDREKLVERWAFSYSEDGQKMVSKWTWASGALPGGYPKISYQGKEWDAVRLNYEVDFKTMADLIEEQW